MSLLASSLSACYKRQSNCCQCCGWMSWFWDMNNSFWRFQWLLERELNCLLKVHIVDVDCVKKFLLPELFCSLIAHITTIIWLLMLCMSEIDIWSQSFVAATRRQTYPLVARKDAHGGDGPVFWSLHHRFRKTWRPYVTGRAVRKEEIQRGVLFYFPTMTLHLHVTE